MTFSTLSLRSTLSFLPAFLLAGLSLVTAPPSNAPDGPGLGGGYRMEDGPGSGGGYRPDGPGSGGGYRPDGPGVGGGYRMEDGPGAGGGY